MLAWSAISRCEWITSLWQDNEQRAASRAVHSHTMRRVNRPWHAAYGLEVRAQHLAPAARPNQQGVRGRRTPFTPTVVRLLLVPMLPRANYCPLVSESEHYPEGPSSVLASTVLYSTCISGANAVAISSSNVRPLKRSASMLSP